MTEQPAAVSFAGAPESMVRDFDTALGVKFEFGGEMTTPAACIAVMVITAAAFTRFPSGTSRERKK